MLLLLTPKNLESLCNQMKIKTEPNNFIKNFQYGHFRITIRTFLDWLRLVDKLYKLAYSTKINLKI